MNLIVTFNLVTFLNFILLGKKTTIQSKTKKAKCITTLKINIKHNINKLEYKYRLIFYTFKSKHFIYNSNNIYPIYLLYHSTEILGKLNWTILSLCYTYGIIPKSKNKSKMEQCYVFCQWYNHIQRFYVPIYMFRKSHSYEVWYVHNWRWRMWNDSVVKYILQKK